MSLDDFALWLEDRGLAFQAFGCHEGWHVRIFAQEDASVGYSATKESLVEAVQAVVSAWDRDVTKRTAS